MLQMLRSFSKCCRDINKCCKCVQFPKRFRVVALVLRTDQHKFQSLMPFKHFPFQLLLLRWPSEATVSCAM